MGEEGVVCGRRDFYNQDRLTAQMYTASVSHHDNPDQKTTKTLPTSSSQLIGLHRRRDGRCSKIFHSLNEAAVAPALPAGSDDIKMTISIVGKRPETGLSTFVGEREFNIYVELGRLSSSSLYTQQGLPDEYRILQVTEGLMKAEMYFSRLSFLT